MNKHQSTELKVRLADTRSGGIVTSEQDEYPILQATRIYEDMYADALEEVPVDAPIGTIYKCPSKSGVGIELWEICQPKVIPPLPTSEELDINAEYVSADKRIKKLVPEPVLRELHDEEMAMWRIIKDQEIFSPESVHTASDRCVFKVLDNGLWRRASVSEMNNWGNLVNKRMDYLIGVISDQ